MARFHRKDITLLDQEGNEQGIIIRDLRTLSKQERETMEACMCKQTGVAR